MRASLSRMLTIDEGKVVLAVLIDVGKGHFDILALDVDEGIKGILGKVFPEQVLEPVLGSKTLSVVYDGEASVEESVIAQHALHVFITKAVFLEHRGVGNKGDEGSVLLIGRLVLLVKGLRFAAGKIDPTRLAFPEGLDVELIRESVNGLDSHPIQSDGFLEGLRIVLRPSVNLRRAVEQFLKGNAPAVVAHLHLVTVRLDLDLLAEAHNELVDAVI